MQDKEIQLFIFPYAGGSIAAFKRLTDIIDDRIDVITVEYAGRGTRAKEPLASSILELLGDAVGYCCDRRNNSIPFAILRMVVGRLSLPFWYATSF